MEKFASLREHRVVRINENKDRFIQKNTLLTDEQKAEVLDFFHSHANLEAKVNNGNWNYEIPYEEFKRVINSVDTQAKRLKKQTKELRKQTGLESLVEGEDYNLLADNSEYTAYEPLTHKGMRVIASNMVEPKLWCDSSIMTWSPKEVLPAGEPMKGDYYPGAKWCVAMETDQHWINYRNQDLSFVVVCQKNPQVADTLKKICFVIDQGEIDWRSSVNAADKSFRDKEEVGADIAKIAEEILTKLEEARKKRREARLKVLVKALEPLRDAKIAVYRYHVVLEKQLTILDKKYLLIATFFKEDNGKSYTSLEEVLDLLDAEDNLGIIITAEDLPSERERTRLNYILGEVLNTSPVLNITKLKGKDLYDFDLMPRGILNFSDLLKRIEDAIAKAIAPRGFLPNKILNFPDIAAPSAKGDWNLHEEGGTCVKTAQKYIIIFSIDTDLEEVDYTAKLNIVFANANEHLEISAEELTRRLTLPIDDPDIKSTANRGAQMYDLNLTTKNADRVLEKVKEALLKLIDITENL